MSSDMLELVTVVNRTQKPLKGTWNGRPYDLPVGERSLPKIVALACRFQNPVMGRGTPLEDWDSKSEYLVGIKELGDDCSPIEQTDAPQRWDSRLVNVGEVETIAARGSLASASSRLPAEGGEGFKK